MLAISLIVFTVVAPQQASQKYAEGQEIRVCGEVVTARPSPSTCEVTLHVKSATDEFDVFIPAAVQKQMTTSPHMLTGGQACFTGKVSVLPASLRIAATTAEVTSMPAGPAFGEGAAMLCGGAVTAPQILKEQKPQYTADAMRARVQGRVEMQVVVGIDGNVSSARVVTPLHPELDEQALRAVKEWKFVPGTVNGKPVPVLVTIEMTFTIRK